MTRTARTDRTALTALTARTARTMTYRLDVRCKLYGRYTTLRAAIIAGLDNQWGTPWQVHLEAPGCFGDGDLEAWHNKFGTRESYLEYVETLTR